jgi:hypothetical protein
MVIKKNSLQDFITEFINKFNTDEFKIEFDKNFFAVRPIEETSVLDLLASEAYDIGPEDLSANIDHYLYGTFTKFG